MFFLAYLIADPAGSGVGGNNSPANNKKEGRGVPALSGFGF